MTKKRAANKRTQTKKNIRENLSFDLTEKQNDIISRIKDKKSTAVIINGVAGTSKTLLAVLCGLEEVRQTTQKEELLYIRTAAESGQIKIGARPGDISEKMDHLVGPLRDKLDEILGREDADSFMGTDKVKAMLVNDVRGSSWRNTFVILDEAQNASYGELITIITRIGEGSKIVLVGDSMQSDIRNSGWEKFCRMFNDAESEQNGVYFTELTEEDVVRSAFVKFIIRKANKEKQREENNKNVSQGKADWRPRDG
jgi:phosphate starvation-inducible PhoH-like protein